MNKTKLRHLSNIVNEHIEGIRDGCEIQDPRFKVLQKERKELQKKMTEEVKAFSKQLLDKFKIPQDKRVKMGRSICAYESLIEEIVKEDYLELDSDDWMIEEPKKVAKANAIEREWNGLMAKAALTVTKEGETKLQESIMAFFKKHNIKVY